MTDGTRILRTVAVPLVVALIFLDVNLPSIKGNRLSEVLKSQSNKKDIPIVLISDLPEKSLLEMFPSSGANAWMRKPLTRDKMVAKIRKYVFGEEVEE